MKETKTTCPNCFDSKRCFVETSDDGFSSYMCMNCGFTSNSAYKKDSKELESAVKASTQLMNDLSIYDYDREIQWFPSTLNMGKFGVIYPEGNKDNWKWKLAQVRKLTPEEQKDPKYQGHDRVLDVDNSKEYGMYEFLDACKEMGIVKDL